MMKPAIVFVGCVLATSPLQAKELTSVGISVGSLGNPYYVALAAGAEHAAKEINPNVKVTALGFELSPEYAERAQSRLDAAHPGQPLAGGDEPTVANTTPKVRKTRKAAPL